LTCPCTTNSDIAKAAQLIAEVKADFEKCTTHTPQEIDVYQQKIHRAQNGTEMVLVAFKKEKRDIEHRIDSWSAAKRDLDRLEVDAKSIKYDMLKTEKLNRDAR